MLAGMRQQLCHKCLFETELCVLFNNPFTLFTSIFDLNYNYTTHEKMAYRHFRYLGPGLFFRL